MFNTVEDLFSHGNIEALGLQLGVDDEALWAKLNRWPAVHSAIHRQYVALLSGDLSCTDQEHDFFAFILTAPHDVWERMLSIVACLVYADEIKITLDAKVLREAATFVGHQDIIRFVATIDEPQLRAIQKTPQLSTDALIAARQEMFAIVFAMAPRQIRAHLATASLYSDYDPNGVCQLSQEDRFAVTKFFSLAVQFENDSGDS